MAVVVVLWYKRCCDATDVDVDDNDVGRLTNADEKDDLLLLGTKANNGKSFTLMSLLLRLFPITSSSFVRVSFPLQISFKEGKNR